MSRRNKGYFANFPQIEYQGKIARNLMARPKIAESLLNNPNAFYDYEIKNDLRPDQVASRYYNDPHLVWLIFLANNITDPYYEWPLNQNQFADFLISKYGSVAAAQAKILHYQKRVGGIASNSRDPNGTIITKETFDLESSFNNINEAGYAPVYAYDYEDELNEAKRKIKLIDSSLASAAKQLLREVMTR